MPYLSGIDLASWGDACAIELEIETIARYLRDGQSVLDVGCANGFSSIRQCARHVLASMTGMDFSPDMIAYAEENRAHSEHRDKLHFGVGDIRDIPFARESFDAVYTTRVVINLPTWQEQQRGIRECLRVLKPGGRFILSEAFWEPLTRLNALRAVVGLAPLVEHDFNRYLKQDRLEAFLAEEGLTFTRDDFSSVYYVGSRLLRELCTDFASYTGYENPINADFFTLEQKYSGGNLGIQQAYVITKGAR